MFRTRGLSAVLLLVLAATACVDGSREDDPAVAGPPPTRAPGSVVVVSGTLTSLHGEETVGPPIPLPFTVELPATGTGDATFNRAVVDGQTRSISWTGGRPLAIEGEGSLDLGPTTVDVDAAGVRWTLDGGPRVLLGTTWRTEAPVAIGSDGLATSRDGVEFEVGPDTVLISTGGAFVRHALTGPLHLEGPGRVTLVGRFELHSEEESADGVTRVRMEEGPFVLDLTPVPGGGIRVEGGLQGRVFVNDTATSEK